ncbi:AAA domain-containing protein [Desulfovibrio aerotolerans]|uniref:AAA domain-containing protein n=1 Tax=Solidesulfovibrio aerotolerans TaxID=295255 RepID=A0A7C9ISP1_9BACT|nr:sigma 54-interacting transcriptional regulator [Solidesulfovibrio aerotolerans]MYL83447.1 AAA domain-containing protein [Solidesulfovibrio aerotolerans]
MAGREWLVLPGMTQVFLRYLSIAKEYLSGKSAIHNKPLMIIGDSGVGKGLFIECAKQLFECRAESAPSLQAVKNASPFIRINCASFTKDLAESEIFGHEKGAFTGATEKKKGIVEEAGGGVLVLDEIGELPESVQAKILIFIEEGEFRRVGSNKIERSNVFIIGTTNQKQGKFRADFWYRFFPIFIPALHERRLDVLYYIALKYPLIFNRLTPQHALSLLAHNWPGNIRELERVISIIMSEDLMRESQPLTGEHVQNKPIPLFFPVDTRQTSLAEMYLSRFCSDLLAADFDIESFNSIISCYGLQVPYSFSISDGLKKIKKIYAELEKKQTSHYYFGKKSFSERSFTKPILDWELNRKFLGKPQILGPTDKGFILYYYPDGFQKEYDNHPMLDLIQKMQNNINDEASFYQKIKICFEENMQRLGHLKNVAVVSRVNKIEEIGVCFSCICNFFLKNSSSHLNVFDQAEVHLAGSDSFGKVQKSIITAFVDAGLVPGALKFASGRKLIFKKKYRVETDWGEYVKSVLRNDDTPGVASGQVQPVENRVVCESVLYKCTEDELLRSYYKYLRSNYDTVVQVCRHAGLNESTCRNKLREFGLLPKQMKEDK